jgi:hypothetical protein
VCSGHGTCFARNSCTCSLYWFGDKCEITTCGGEISTNPETCGKHGTCVAPDTCTCVIGFVGANCNETACHGVSIFNTTSVCSGNGQCKSGNICECNPGYTGSTCSEWACFGVQRNDTSVCGGIGACKYPNQCYCHEDEWIGNENCKIPYIAIFATNMAFLVLCVCFVIISGLYDFGLLFGGYLEREKNMRQFQMQFGKRNWTHEMKRRRESVIEVELHERLLGRDRRNE